MKSINLVILSVFICLHNQAFPFVVLELLSWNWMFGNCIWFYHTFAIKYLNSFSLVKFIFCTLHES